MLEDPATLVVLRPARAPGRRAMFAPMDRALRSARAERAARQPATVRRQHWLGTDQFGRDVLSRIIYGARTSLLLGIIAPLLAAVIGTMLGVIAGYFGGWIDRVIGRLDRSAAGVSGPAARHPDRRRARSGLLELVAVLTIAFAPRFARIARASTLAIRNEPFIEAAIARRRAATGASSSATSCRTSPARSSWC